MIKTSDMTTPEDILKDHRLWDVKKIYDPKIIIRVNVVSAMKTYAEVYHREQKQASKLKLPQVVKKALRLFGVVRFKKYDKWKKS